MLLTEINLKYYNAKFNIALADIKTALLLEKEPVQLTAVVHQGNLFLPHAKNPKANQLPAAQKRTGKKSLVIRQPLHLLSF